MSTETTFKVALVRLDGTIAVGEVEEPHPWAKEHGFGRTWAAAVDKIGGGRWRDGYIKETTGPAAHPWCSRFEDDMGRVLFIDGHEGRTLD